ncbi:MAG TPA: dual specificity protein phosphatase [Pirellulales bacterium]|jgi:protein-tyrosine phosphatase
MNRIDGFPLWIGNAADGCDWLALFDRGVRAVVQLAIEELPIEPPREVLFYRFPLVDGEGNDPAILRLAIDGVAELIRAGLPTLVCCAGGMSRSPAIVAAAISVVNGTDIHKSLEIVTESHPSDVSTALWGDILRAVA